MVDVADKKILKSLRLFLSTSFDLLPHQKMKNCPYCGTKLRKTNYGRLGYNRKWCPNCGIMDNNKEKSNVEDPDYIG